MKAHFVTFYSPGTFFHEETTRPIAAWDVPTAVAISRSVVERYNAKPFGFRFSTRERGAKDLDSRVTKESKMYYLGGMILTVKDIARRKNPKDEILLSNMRCNHIDRVVQNDNSWRCTQPLNEGDVVLDMEKYPPTMK